MRTKLLLVLFAVLLGIAALSMLRASHRPASRSGPPPGYRHFFRCAACGYDAELPPAEIGRLYREDRVKADAAGRHFFECPSCGEIRMVMKTETPEGEVSRIPERVPARK